MAAATETATRELTFTRTFAAPRSLVFKVWTDPVHFAQWWGPHEFTNPVCELDLRPGGAINIHMRGPDGVTFPCGGAFREIVEPERLVFTTMLVDDDGTIQVEILNTVTFAERDGGTVLTLHTKVLQATAEGEINLAGMEEGWSQSLERLADHVRKL